jgi:hypothetical protein
MTFHRGAEVGKLRHMANGMIFVLLACSFSCMRSSDGEIRTDASSDGRSSMEQISRPYARYWWFASEIKREDVKYNLDWLKLNGFGGVEIAWVYPRNAMDKKLDTTYTPRQEWLSSAWQEVVEYAALYADSIGLACDMTMGTLWPFGDSYVSYEEASQQYGEGERQLIRKSWEHPKTGFVVDHLDPGKYLPYFRRMLNAFPHPATKLPPSYFIDSWEVHAEKLWTDGFKDEFMRHYGYDISPFMDSIYTRDNRHRLYDYRKMISNKVINFYENFDRLLNEKNIRSRGQCSGAPCDIISAYARLDIPEGEAMLYEPEFNSIPASAAMLASKSVVSAETFTCLYGWPRDYIRQEQIADLMLVADALFANGVNHIVWHGKPHNTKDQDTVSFYASVHVGSDGALAAEIPAFNQYLTTVSETMKQGRSYSDVAVYLPTEDAWIKGILPKDKQFIWAWGYYEMRYTYFPAEVAGHHPIWINQEFLTKGVFESGVFRVGDARFRSLYIDVEFLDYEVLRRIRTLAEQGLSITLKRPPREAGTIKHGDWGVLLNTINGLSNVSAEFSPKRPALIEGTDIPTYWARMTDEALYIFFAHPRTEKLTFPLAYGHSFTDATMELPVIVNYEGERHATVLQFEPYSSLLYKIEKGTMTRLDIDYVPKTPVIKARSSGYEAPWLVR